MNDIEVLHYFYQKAVLPQFGITNADIHWNHSADTGPDETAHYFAMDGSSYVLIFEDYCGLGSSDAYIREHVLESLTDYEFVVPTSQTGDSPSYDGFHLPAPYKYCPGITGTFSLIKLAKL